MEKLPENYKSVGIIDIKQDKSLALRLNIATAIVAILMVAFGILLGLYCPNFHFSLGDGLSHITLYLMIFCFSSVFMVIFHELIHGLFMYIFSHKKVKYGLSLTYAYAGMPNYYFNRNQYTFIILAPLILLGLLFAVLMLCFSPMTNLLFYFLFCIHLISCLVDLYTYSRLLTLKNARYLMDTGANITFYAPESPSHSKTT